MCSRKTGIKFWYILFGGIKLSAQKILSYSLTKRLVKKILRQFWNCEKKGYKTCIRLIWPRAKSWQIKTSFSAAWCFTGAPDLNKGIPWYNTIHSNHHDDPLELVRGNQVAILVLYGIHIISLFWRPWVELEGWNQTGQMSKKDWNQSG